MIQVRRGKRTPGRVVGSLDRWALSSWSARGSSTCHCMVAACGSGHAGSLVRLIWKGQPALGGVADTGCHWADRRNAAVNTYWHIGGQCACCEWRRDDPSAKYGCTITQVLGVLLKNRTRGQLHCCPAQTNSVSRKCINQQQHQQRGTIHRICHRSYRASAARQSHITRQSFSLLQARQPSVW